MIHSGDIIGEYRILSELGSGAYGMVFSAENTVSLQRVALKLIPLCGRAGTREMHALRQYRDISHPNLIQIHHSGVFNDYLYYTMDLAEGKLADQKLAPAALREAAVKIADALALLHDCKLLHRDIKPDNLFWLHGKPLLGDIGLLTSGDGASLAGTPGFLSPDIRKDGCTPSARSDLYALAKSFYCLLSGKGPEAYPGYSGPLDPDASILLRGVLAVCDGGKEITTAVSFRDFLLRTDIRVGNSRRKHSAVFLTIGGILLLAAAGAASANFFRNASSRTFSPADSRSAAEKAAIARQQKKFSELQQEAKRLAQEKYPFQPRQRISMNEIWAKEEFRIKYLEDAVRRRIKNDRMFRCFYEMKNEADAAAAKLEALREFPKDSPEWQNASREWQQKNTAYLKERDALLF